MPSSTTDTSSRTPVNLADRLLPGFGLLRRGKRGAGLFLLISSILFLVVLFWRFGLVVTAFRSLGAGVLLFGLSPDDFQAVFTPETLEFWIAAIYLTGALAGIFFFSRRALDNARKEETDQQRQEIGIAESGWRSFKKHTIALYASVVIFTLYSVAFLAPLVSPFNPFQQQDFLVTAYQPPLTTIEALVLEQRKGITIPPRDDRTLSGRLTNSMIRDLQTLKHRNEPNKLMFIDEWRQEGQAVIYRQGSREKTIPVDRLRTGSNGFTVSHTFVLGTDQYGRDILSRVIYGSRISLSIGFLVVLISVTLGTVIGVSSGYFGGLTDNILMRIVDVLIAFPALFLILIIIAIFGNSIFLIVITLSFTGWMGVARLVRSQVLSLKEQEFILAARSLGLSNMRIIFRHLVPNTLTPVIVAATLRIGSIILTEAGLSFLGLGVQPPTPSWGNIINEGRDSLLNHWWISTFPGIAILSTVVCFNLIGDGVRDALDPRMRA
ncbi:ABC transporter permease [Prosthecochloris sp. ZM_2]|uniref:ABC transporter permease n=1 Tax=Prosthecochloris sp. ZM_2 TaxID=2045206 RepID=UPI000DF80E43|nr:ABC transporter permease [Prosthecochloris sp. ZM_2]RNA64688.1 ABC transporter permease [Prosthecochloris sp. ZM_2]